MSRYTQELKQAVMKRMMPLESRSVVALSRETGITETTLYNWRNVARRTGAMMPDRGQNKQVRVWRAACEQANARREVDAATQGQQHKADKRRILGLERKLHRKEKAVAEAATLLVLAKKYRAFPQQDEDI